METEAFIQAIAAEPDSDLPRLVFADWLEDNGQLERAELIRLSCQLDPDRDRFDDETINDLRNQVDRLLLPERDADWRWRNELDPNKNMGNYVGIEWRRGFVDTLKFPVQWFLEFGVDFRKRYPLLRKLVIYRLNGWGERLATCKWLKGIREIEFPCWYCDDDAEAVATSPHLGAVERVVLWEGGGLNQALLFARGSAWPNLRELHLVSQNGLETEWVQAVNKAAGRQLATVYDFSRELRRFPFAAHFGQDYGFFVGRLPDGEQLFAWGEESVPTAEGWLFNPNGTRNRPFQFHFPPELVLPHEPWGTDAYYARSEREGTVRAARKQYLAEQTGFVPAFIRVEGFNIDALEMTGPFYDEGDYPVHHWGERDDPDFVPEHGLRGGGLPNCGGVGECAYKAVRSAEYKFFYGDCLWICDRTGEVVFT